MTDVLSRPPQAGVNWSRRVGYVAVGVLSVAAWLGLVAWDASAYGRYLDHDGLVESALPAGTAVALFVAGWVVMLVAMMLPSTHALVSTFARVVSSRPDRGRLLVALLAGYLVVWTTVGLVAFGLDEVLHSIVDRSTVLHDNEWLIGVAVIALAGLYQFSPVKDRCLAACRSPQAFVFGRWRGGNAVSESFMLGAAHGRFCVGCCIALMLLMFAIGMGNLGWMFALAVVMTVEKLAPWGPRLVAPVGVALWFAAAGALLARL